MTANHRPDSPRIQQLKAQAKDLKESGCVPKHHLALKFVASREGFDSWEELVAADAQADCDTQPTEAQVREAQHRAVIYGRTR